LRSNELARETGSLRVHGKRGLEKMAALRMAGIRADSGAEVVSEPLAKLVGINFLAVTLDCSKCEWRGEVGDMRVFVVHEPAATEFGCPICQSKLARHDGQLPDELW